MALTLFGALRMLYFRYMKSYRRRIFILTNGVIYFANCCQYGSCLTKMYERLGLDPDFLRVAKGPFYGHIRSFEGTVEELKVRLQHEQMRFRDLGVRYAFFV